MGFEIPRRTALITFEGTDYDGAEIECLLDVPLQFLFDLQRASAADGESQDVYRRWAEVCLLGWNLDEKGQPIPVSVEGFLTLPPAMVALIFRNWTEATTSVPGPLGSQSHDGTPSAERSIRRVG